MVSENIFVTMLTFFLLAFNTEVIFVSYLYGSIFSPKADNFNSLFEVYACLSIFILVIAVTNYKIETNINFSRKIISIKSIDLFVFLLLMSFATYLFVTKGIRLYGGVYKEAAENRSVIESYAIIFAIFLLYITKGRLMVLVAFVFIALAFGLAGERFNMLAYSFAVYIFLRTKQNDKLFRLFIFLAFFLATWLSLIRANLGINQDLFHISHFGAVTISSMYLIEYMDFITSTTKAKYFFGMIYGNLVPSSLIPEGFNIKNDLLATYTIPGGGWLPVWIYVTSGYIGVITFSLLFSLLLRKLSLKIQKIENNFNSAYVLFFLLLVIFLPRWINYSPFEVFKFPIYIFIMYLLYVSFKKNLKKRKNL
jgi:hypothetical protein